MFQFNPVLYVLHVFETKLVHTLVINILISLFTDPLSSLWLEIVVRAYHYENNLKL